MSRTPAASSIVRPKNRSHETALPGVEPLESIERDVQGQHIDVARLRCAECFIEFDARGRTAAFVDPRACA